MANCKRCGAVIEFVKLNTGAMIPLDAKTLAVIIKDNAVPGDVFKVVRGRESHFATCKYAAEFRKKKPLTKTVNNDNINVPVTPIMIILTYR